MLSVTTFGKFQIVNEYGVLNDDNNHSVMLTKLLVFLITYRGRYLTTDELAMALWYDDEVDNPAGALKNLMYRLRLLLKKILGEAEYIISTRGSYGWNPKVELELDTEKFERFIENAKHNKTDIQTKIREYEQAILLYQGEFMAKLSEVHWVTTLCTYYHSMYLSAVKNLAELYIEAGMFDELERISNAALQYDSADEQLHYFLIFARMKKQKLQLAMESYEKACEILYQELGVRNSVKLQKIYRELLSMNKGKAAEQMECVQADMVETNPRGAFFCGYPVFREIYRFEARRGSVTGETEYLLLLTMQPEGMREESGAKLEQFRIKNAMKHLENTLKKALRMGDVFSKYSDTQFVILLPCCNYESGMLVANRIILKFYDENSHNKGMQIAINLEKVMTAGKLVQ